MSLMGMLLVMLFLSTCCQIMCAFMRTSPVSGSTTVCPGTRCCVIPTHINCTAPRPLDVHPFLLQRTSHVCDIDNANVVFSSHAVFGRKGQRARDPLGPNYFTFACPLIPRELPSLPLSLASPIPHRDVMVSIAVLVAMLAISSGALWMAPEPEQPDFLPQLIVTTKPGSKLDRNLAQTLDYTEGDSEVGRQTVAQILGVDADSRVHLEDFDPDTHVSVWATEDDGEGAQQAIDKLGAHEDVEYVERDMLCTFDSARMGNHNNLVTPNDPLFKDMWHLGDNPGSAAQEAWSSTKGSPDQVVAVLDTGILKGHPDLRSDERLLPGYDFVSNRFMGNDGDGRDADASDPGDWIEQGQCGVRRFRPSSWHGSHVAGTIAANTNNDEGVAGISWNAKVLPVRVLGKCGGRMSDIAAAIRWSAGLHVGGMASNQHPASVINLSLGGRVNKRESYYPNCPPTYQRAITDAIEAGAVVVVAAGNSGANSFDYAPANCAGVVTVGATDSGGRRAMWSNYGTKLLLSAPGVGIHSAVNGGQRAPTSDMTYDTMDGTSMAAPHVAGAVALLRGLRPQLSVSAVRTELQRSVSPFPSGTMCDNHATMCGAGILNIAKLIEPFTQATDEREDGADTAGFCCGEDSCPCSALGCSSCCAWIGDECINVPEFFNPASGVESMANGSFPAPHRDESRRVTEPGELTFELPAHGLPHAPTHSRPAAAGGFGGSCGHQLWADITFNAAADAFETSPQAVGSFPVHGNWCGPGHGGGESIDAIDEACKVHDNCYGNKGYSDCGCDAQLIRALPGAIRDTPDAKAKRIGTLIRAYFSVAPCLCRTEVPCGVKCSTCGGVIKYPCNCRVRLCKASIPSCCGRCP